MSKKRKQGLEIIGEVSALNLKPDSVVVVTLNWHPQPKDEKRFQELIAATFPHHRTLLLSPGVSVDVVGE